AGNAISGAGANGVGAAAANVQSAGQSAAQGLQAAERGAKQPTRPTLGGRTPRLTSQILRDQLNQRLGQSQAHHHHHISMKPAPSNGAPSESPSATTAPKL